MRRALFIPCLMVVGIAALVAKWVPPAGPPPSMRTHVVGERLPSLSVTRGWEVSYPKIQVKMKSHPHGIGAGTPNESAQESAFDLPAATEPADEPLSPARLGERLYALIEGLQYEEFEKAMNSSATEDIKAGLTSDLAMRFEARYGALPMRARGLIAWLLSYSDDPGVSDFLATRLRIDAEPEVRRAEVLALQGRRDDASTRGLIETLRSDADPGVRAAAAYGLAERSRQDSMAMRALIDQARLDPSEGVRSAATRALGRFASREAAKAALASLDDPSPEVRRAAAEALSRQGDGVDHQGLAMAHQRELDPTVRQALEEATLQVTHRVDPTSIGGCMDPADMPIHDNARPR